MQPDAPRLDSMPRLRASILLHEAALVSSVRGFRHPEGGSCVLKVEGRAPSPGRRAHPLSGGLPYTHQ